MLTQNRLLPLAVLALAACGGPEGEADTQDALTITANYLNPCLLAAADRSVSFGSGRASKQDVAANSGTIGFASYMSSERLCRKFVVDATLPAGNLYAATSVARFESGVFADITTAEICATVELEVSLYSKVDGGSWTYHGKKSYVGEWRSFGSYCRATPVDGGADTIDVPAVASTTSRVFRVLTVGTAFGGFPIHVVTGGHLTNPS